MKVTDDTSVSLTLERYDELLAAETRIKILKSFVSGAKYVPENILSIIGIEKAAVTDDKERSC